METTESSHPPEDSPVGDDRVQEDAPEGTAWDEQEPYDYPLSGPESRNQGSVAGGVVEYTNPQSDDQRADDTAGDVILDGDLESEDSHEESRSSENALSPESSQSTNGTGPTHSSNFNAMAPSNVEYFALRKPMTDRTEKDILVLEELMLKIKFGLEIEEANRRELCQYLEWKEIRAGQDVFRQGDIGDVFYIIIRGTVAVIIEDNGQETTVAHLHTGDSFGELALLQDNSPRRATVTCKDNCEFALLRKEHYDRILSQESKKEVEEKVHFLKKVPIFGQLSDRRLESIAYVMTRREYVPKQIVVAQGEEIEDLYIVQKGSIKMIRQMSNSFGQGWVQPAEWKLSPSPRKLSRNRAVISTTKMYIDGKITADCVTPLQSTLHEINDAKAKAAADAERRQQLAAGAREKLRRAVMLKMHHTKLATAFQRVALDAMRQAQTVQQPLTPEEVHLLQHAHKIGYKNTILLEVATAGKYEFFAEQAVTKNAQSAVTVITSSTTVLYILNKWDLLKRLDKRSIEAIVDAGNSAIDEGMLKEQYTRSLHWDRYKKLLVKDIICQYQAEHSSRPSCVWEGPFRTQPGHKAPQYGRWR